MSFTYFKKIQIELNSKSMNKTITIKVIFILAILFNGQLLNAQEGKVWVTVDDLSILPKLNSKGELASTSSSFQKLVRDFEITNVVLAFPAAKSRNLQKVYEVQCHCNQKVLSAALEKSVVGMSKPEEVPVYDLLYTPDDYNTAFAVDYALDLIQAKGAWDITQGDTNIVLGISDANFVPTNLELVGKINYVEPGMSDPNITHGTQVAITAAGNTDNGIGKSSIGFNSHMRLYTMGFNQILQASNDGVRVINMSWASGCSLNNYCQSIIDEIHDNGTIMVAAAGNGGTCGGPTMLVYPAAYNHVISVTSVGADSSHERLNAAGVIVTHQHNEFVDISAPGYTVPLIGPTGSAGFSSGTSFASPLVTGTVGLMLAVNPCLNAEDVEFILKETATDISAINPNYIDVIGAGLLNAQAAVEMAQNFSKLSFTYTQTDFACVTQLGSVEVNTIGGTAPYTVTWNNGNVGSTMENLAEGTYTITVVDSSGCMGDTTIIVTNLGSPAINFDYTNNIIINSPTYVLTDLNNDGIIKIKGNITVANGVNYTMETKKLEFGYNTDPFSGIIIEDNATLSITKNSSLKGLSTCQSRWDGIVIKDNSDTVGGTTTYSTSAGRLILDKTSIYDAEIGVKTEVLDPFSTNANLKHGTFKISNSVFTDNEIGVYVLSSASETTANEISKSIFLLEDSSVTNPIHILAMNSNNLVILNNSFFGNDAVADELRGSGIKAKNSNLYIAQDQSTDLLNLPSNGNQFYNLSYGIQTSNTDNIVKTHQISGCYFTKVKESINLDKYSTGLIAKNEINIPLGDLTNKSFGIKMTSNSSMIVTDNLFTTSGICPIEVYGVIMEESDTNKMDVYRNKFEGNFTVANLFKGNNLKTFVDCNSYTGNNENHWVVSGGKLSDQTGMDINGQSLIYKNEFGICHNGAPQILINADAVGFVYQSKVDFMPATTTPSVIQSIIIKNAEDNQCKNFFDTSVPVPTIDKLDFGNGAFVFPNPTVNVSAVNWNNVDIDQITIYTSNGEMLSNVSVSGIEGSFEISDLASGMYFVKLAFKDSVFKTEKLVVSK